MQLVNSITVCTDGRDIVESADKGVKVFDTGQFDFYFVGVALFEFVVLLSDSFTVVPKSWAYVVQSTECFVLKWETACRSSTCVVRSFFFYLDTDFVDILFRVPLCYLFRRRTLFAFFKSLIKVSKGFKKWNCRNCFSKTGLNTSFLFAKLCCFH